MISIRIEVAFCGEISYSAERDYICIYVYVGFKRLVSVICKVHGCNIF